MSNKDAIQFLKKDPLLAEIITRVGNYKIKIIKNHYESLVEAIINQQLTGVAANRISKNFRTLYSSKFPKPIDVINTPTPKLQKTGLSKMKIQYIKKLSQKIISKEVDLDSLSKLADEEVIMKLTKIEGIGRWTAEMFLIFSLGRKDVLPVGDHGLKKGIQQLFSMKKLPEETKIQKIAERWRPYRTIATWYLWKSLKKFDTIG